MGMLAWFVNIFNRANALTPDEILILFIISVLALAWAIFTLFSYHRSSANARFVAIIDLAFFGALIAAIYELRGVAKSDCTNVSRSGDWTANIGDVAITGPGWDFHTDKPCAMLKASWALAIINCILFFFTAIVAFSHGDRMGVHEDRSRSHHSQRHHSSRHSHRSRSGSHRSHSRTRRVYV